MSDLYIFLVESDKKTMWKVFIQRKYRSKYGRLA